MGMKGTQKTLYKTIRSHMSNLPDQPNSSCLEKAAAPVQRTLILICEKCGSKIATQDQLAENPAVTLRQTLKGEIKQRFPKKTMRAVLTGCLDICPEGSISVAVVALAPGDQAPCFYTIPKQKLAQATEALLAV
jgi:predicted metal-binding protein